MRKMWCGIIALSTLVIQPLETMAEEPIERSLQELLSAGRLGPGDTVYVTRTVGRRSVRGTVEDLSPSALTLTDGQIKWTLPEEQILSVERRDSVANGIWTGLGLALLPICAYSRSSEQASYQMLYYGGPLLAGAALVGGLVDSSIRETLYRAPGRRRTRLSSTVLNGGFGGSLSLEW